MKWFSLPFLGRLLIVAVFMANSGVAQIPEPRLKIGDPAPKIEAIWIKGDPVTQFRPGQVYLVEFWATWCGPCNQVMPHLSELQRRHKGKLTIIGVNVRETNDRKNVDPGTVKKSVTHFVDKKGNTMDYVVAMDDPVRQTVFDAWMTAGGVYGIPTSFLVDGTGKVVWIGSPYVKEYDSVIQQALEGKSDLVAARTLQNQFNEENWNRKRDLQIRQPLMDARERKDYAGMVAEADRLTATQSDNAYYVQQAYKAKMAALLHLNEAQAFAYREATLKDEKFIKLNSWNDLASKKFTADVIMAEEGLSTTAYRKAIEYQVAWLNHQKDDISSYQYLAFTYDRLGDRVNAVESQKKVVEIARNDTSGMMPKEWIEEFEQQLEVYRKKLDEAGGGRKARVGEPAPPLDAMKWINGAPIGKYEKGQVYLVEFWATYCYPCLAYMPHLKKIQEQHRGRVTVIAVDVMEGMYGSSTKDIKDIRFVEKVIERQEAMRTLLIAIDDPKSNAIYHAWKDAMVEVGVPSTFIVDGGGRLAWAGNPVDPVDEVLADVLSGMDSSALAAKYPSFQQRSAQSAQTITDPAQKASFDKTAHQQKWLEPAAEALRNENYVAVLAACDRYTAEMEKLYGKDAQNEARIFQFRLKGLLQTDEAAALAYARANIKPGDSYYDGGAIANEILGSEKLSKAAYRYGLELMEQSMVRKKAEVESGKGQRYELYGLFEAVGLAHMRLGEFAKALDCQEKALQYLRPRIEDAQGQMNDYRASESRIEYQMEETRKKLAGMSISSARPEVK